jgi:CRP-like cAMP-binding protein
MTAILEKFNKKELLTFHKDQVIIDFDSICNGVYIVSEGKINIIKKDNGIEKQLFTISKNQILGLTEILQGERSECKAVANETVKVYFISGSDFLSSIKNDKALRLEVMQKFSKQISKIEAQSKNVLAG